MLRSPLALLAPIACLAAGPAFAGNLYVVDKAMGPGATHSTIIAALTATVDGDEILIRAGAYPENVLIFDRSIALIAEKDAAVSIVSLRIEDLSAGKSVVVSGIRATIAGFLSKSPLHVDECAGSIWIQDCSFEVVGNAGLAVPTAAFLYRSATVSLHRCELRAGINYEGPGLWANSAKAFLFDTLVTGGDGHTSTVVFGGVGFPPTDAGPGVRLSGSPNPYESSLFAQGCTIRGGQGGSSALPEGTPCVDGANGGPGLRLDGGTAVLLDTVLAGGAGGTTPDPCVDGQAGPASVISSGSLSTPPGNARSLAVAQPIREGETTAIALDGQPGDLAWILVSGAQLPHAPWFGTGVLLVAEPFQIVFAGVTDAAGHKSFPVTLGEIGVTSTEVFLQGVFFSPSEDFPHSSGAMALLLDSAVL